MTTLREAAQQALEALGSSLYPQARQMAAIAALKAALAEPTPLEDVVTHGSAWSKNGKRIDPMSVYAEPVQQGCDHCNQPLYAAVKCRECGRVTEPVQEPVAWKDKTYESLHHQDFGNSIPLYTAPPQRKPLSEDEALDIARTFGAQPWPPGSCVAFARAIERAHNITGDNT